MFSLFIPSFLFFVVLEIARANPSSFFIFAPLTIFAQILIGLFGLKKPSRYLLPAFYVVSGLLVTLAPPPTPQHHLLFILISVGYAFLVFALRHMGESSRDEERFHLLSLACLFIFFVSIFYLAAFFNVSFTAMLFAIALGAGWITFITIPRSPYSFLSSLLGALLMSETGWAISFFPFSYLTIASFLFIIYYTLWKLLRASLTQTLTRRVLIANLLFLLAGGAVIAVLTPWLP